MSTQVVFSGTAKNDLREIAVHLAKRSGSRELAVRFVRELQEQTAILAQFPESGAFPQDRMLKSSVNVETAKICRDNGANVLVAGSAYFKAADPAVFVRAVKA